MLGFRSDILRFASNKHFPQFCFVLSQEMGVIQSCPKHTLRKRDTN